MFNQGAYCIKQITTTRLSRFEVYSDAVGQIMFSVHRSLQVVVTDSLTKQTSYSSYPCRRGALLSQLLRQEAG